MLLWCGVCLAEHTSDSSSRPIIAAKMVTKRSVGSLPPPPKRPVYHSPPINAFSLKDLIPKQSDEEIFYTVSSLLKQSRHFNGIISPQPQPGHFGHGLSIDLLKSLQTANTPVTGFFESAVNDGNRYGTGFDLANQYKNLRFSASFTPHAGPSLPNLLSAAANIPRVPKLLEPTYSKDELLVNTEFSNPSGYAQDHLAGNNYAFSYDVIHNGEGPYGKGEGQFFGHSEHRVGATTRGRYHVLLPDGRHQQVDYKSDPLGYRASVKYNYA